MPVTDLLFKRQHTQVGTQFPTLGFPLPALVEFDAAVSETHTDDVEATAFPVEDGAEITDHMRKLPATCEIDGLVSNTPITYLASLQAKSPIIGDLKPTLDRVEAAYSKLREFQTAGVLVDVITGLRSYRNMALLTIAVSRDASTGNILNSRLTFREMLTATAMSMGVPIPEDKANETSKNAGKKSTSAAGSSAEGTSTASQSSTLSDLLGRLGSLV